MHACVKERERDSKHARAQEWDKSWGVYLLFRSLMYICMYIYIPSQVCCLTQVLLMVHTAGECEGDATTRFDIDGMQAASAPWIRSLLAQIISKNIALAANQGDISRDVVVSVT